MTIILMTYLFTADIWGTVSDWVMISVTAITAFFLFKTLKSQKEVQQTQNEMFRIESIRFKESIKPVLKYAATITLNSGVEGKNKLTVEVTNETNTVALNIALIPARDKHTSQIHILTPDVKRDHLTKGDNPLLYHFLVDSNSQISNCVNFSINYQDIAGTKYKQGVLCICDKYGIEIKPYLPEMITLIDNGTKTKINKKKNKTSP
jgi:hypothetical protein